MKAKENHPYVQDYEGYKAFLVALFPLPTKNSKTNKGVSNG